MITISIWNCNFLNNYDLVFKKFKDMKMFDEKSVGKFPKTNAQIDELEKKINKVRDESNF